MPAVGAVIRQLLGGLGTTGARVRYGSVVLTEVVFVASLAVWNLLGWRT